MLKVLLSPVRHVAITLIAFMVVGLFALVTINVSFLNPIARTLEEFSMTDLYFQALQSTASPDTSRAIAIVDMTKLYDRRHIATCIEEIENIGPKVLGIDIVFEGEKYDNIEGDIAMMTIAQKYKNIIYSYRLLGYNLQQHQYAKEIHSFFADSTNITEGHTNMERSLYAGIKRDLHLGRRSMGKQKASFVSVVVNKYTEKETVPNDGDMSINFTPTHFQNIPYDSILYYQELIKDRIVLLGSTSEESDMHYTPLGKMAGVELLAYSINTLLNRQEIRKLPMFLSILFSFLLVFLTQLLQDAYEKRIGKMRYPLLRTFLSSSVALGILTFFWMVIIMWIGFLLFTIGHLSLTLGWALSAIAFVDAARSFYDTCTESLK
jgi:CHASE2 domain-containing sensor protein